MLSFIAVHNEFQIQGGGRKTVICVRSCPTSSAVHLWLQPLTYYECNTRKSSSFNQVLSPDFKKSLFLNKNRKSELDVCCFRMQRIPASRLSIHPMQSPFFRSMAFPLYRVSVGTVGHTSMSPLFLLTQHCVGASV